MGDVQELPEIRAEYPSQEAQMTRIDHPEYYAKNGIEAIDFIEAHSLNFNLGNVIKYVTRAGRKEGEDTLTDLRKAHWYLEREIERLKKGENQS